MFLTTKMNENCTLERLENDVDAATVYIAFFEPKYQQKAIELIYHKKNPGVNLQWFYKKRQELEKEGYLTRCDTKLKGSVYKSNIEPVINTIREEINKRGSLLIKDDAVIKDSFNDLRLILDSKWFRDFYSKKRLEYPFRYTNGKIISTYQPLDTYIAGGRLKVTNVKHLLLNLINEIGNYSYTYNKLMSSFTNFEFKDQVFYPDIQDLLHVGSFDKFFDEKSQYIPDKAIDLFYHDLVSDSEILIDNVNRMEKNLSIYLVSRDTEFKTKSRDTGLCEFRFESTYKHNDFSHERELELPKAFIDSIKEQSALIPLSVANIMRKCYRDPSLAVEERCKNLLDHYQDFL